MKSIVINFFFFLLFTIGLYGQSPCTDFVYLKDGSKLRGKIQEYVIDEYLMLQIENGNTTKIGGEKIKKVIQDCEEHVIKNEVEKKYYLQSSLYALIGRSLFNEVEVGSGGQIVGGIKVNKWLGLGAGLGLEFYAPKDNTESSSFPVFGEVRWIMPTQNYLSLATGYGFADKNDTFSSYERVITERKGGLYLSATSGIKLGKHLALHVGWTLQKKTLVWRSIYIGENSGIDRISNNRIALGMSYIW